MSGTNHSNSTQTDLPPQLLLLARVQPILLLAYNIFLLMLSPLLDVHPQLSPLMDIHPLHDFAADMRVAKPQASPPNNIKWSHTKVHRIHPQPMWVMA